MFDMLERARLQDLHCHYDEASGLKAIIAIHNTNLGPALGGCRCIHYSSDQAALVDSIRLARGMSYKAAMAGIEQGGGKGVILLPQGKVDREALYAAYGDFVDSLNGQYITAADSGTHLTDLDVVALHTSYVVGTSSDGLDPSPATADGVLAGIQAAVAFKLKRADLDGIHVAIQGVGHVGGALARLLAAEGARLTLADVSQQLLEEVAAATGANTCSIDEILAVECDVLSPCALGAVLNEHSIPDLRCSIVAGSANNQLGNPEHGDLLHRRKILYAPDYVVNAGGVIRLSLGHKGQVEQIAPRVKAIGEVLTELFERSASSAVPTHLVADQMAEAKIFSSGKAA